MTSCSDDHGSDIDVIAAVMMDMAVQLLVPFHGALFVCYLVCLVSYILPSGKKCQCLFVNNHNNIVLSGHKCQEGQCTPADKGKRGYKCVCRTGYEGRFCENKSEFYIPLSNVANVG